MSNEYFKSVLTAYEGHDDLVVKEFSVSSGTNKGENFASAIFRVTIKYLLRGEAKETQLIVKAQPENGAISEMLSEQGVFEAETHVYRAILGEFEKLIPNFKVAPRYLSAISRTLRFLLMGINFFVS